MEPLVKQTPVVAVAAATGKQVALTADLALSLCAIQLLLLQVTLLFQLSQAQHELVKR